MNKNNDIIAVVKYDGEVKKFLQNLMAKFDNSQKEEDIDELLSAVSTIHHHIGNKHPEIKGNEIVVLFEEDDEIDLTVLINSTPSTNEFSVVEFPNGERGFVF